MTKHTDTPKQDPLPTPVLASTPAPLSLQIPANVAYAVQYTGGMFLTADLMTTQENYFVNWLQLQNQLLYTSGVLNGLFVKKTGPNSVAVQTGAGFDSYGHFLILPGNDDGQPATIPPNPTNQDYRIYLVYPDPGNPVVVESNVINMASTLVVQDAGKADPDQSVVLAKITVTDGAISDVTDLRNPVNSRLPANLGSPVSTAAKTMMTSSASQLNLQTGMVSVSRDGLRKLGDTVQQVVEFNVPPGTFTQIPHVVVTVLGTLPYAASVLNVDTKQFTLALTCVVAPAAYNIEPISVQWLAYVE